MPSVLATLSATVAAMLLLSLALCGPVGSCGSLAVAVLTSGSVTRLAANVTGRL
jgi:hypothetical protein